MNALIALALVMSSDGSICPANITTTQSLRPPAGWEAMQSTTPSYLIGVGFFSGHPSRRMGFKYESLTETKGFDHLRYRLDGIGELWVECEYSSSSVTLVRKIPKASSCTVSKSKGQGLVSKIDCAP